MQFLDVALTYQVKRRNWISLLLALIVAGGCLSARMASPPTSGLLNGRLAPCPNSPNCVCSQDDDPTHHIAPFRFGGSADQAMERLQNLIVSEPRTTVIESSSTYLRVEYRSRLFGFVDDVEFLLGRSAGIIEVRSASRVGYSDLGVNRRRIERLRAAFISPASPIPDPK